MLDKAGYSGDWPIGAVGLTPSGALSGLSGTGAGVGSGSEEPQPPTKEPSTMQTRRRERAFMDWGLRSDRKRDWAGNAGPISMRRFP